MSATDRFWASGAGNFGDIFDATVHSGLKSCAKVYEEAAAKIGKWAGPQAVLLIQSSLLCAVSLFFVSPAHAVMEIFTVRSQFLAATGSTGLLDFEHLVGTSEFPINYFPELAQGHGFRERMATIEGMTFRSTGPSDAFIYIGDRYIRFNGYYALDDSLYSLSFGPDSSRIDFGRAFTSFGMDYGYGGQQIGSLALTVQFWDGGPTVQFNAPVLARSQFIGLVGREIKTISILNQGSRTLSNPLGPFLVLDNIAFTSPVPEPPPVILFTFAFFSYILTRQFIGVSRFSRRRDVRGRIRWCNDIG